MGQINSLEMVIERVKALREVKECSPVGEAVFNGTCHAEWCENRYYVDFESTVVEQTQTAYYKGVEPFKFSCNGEDFVVPERGANVYDWRRDFINPDKVKLNINHFYSVTLNPEKAYYLRYVTSISKYAYGNITHDIGCRFPLKFSMTDVEVNLLEEVDGNYLTVETMTPLTLEQMSTLSFNILLSFGFLIGEMPLDECYVFAYDTPDLDAPIGMEYRSLVKTLRNDYRIFTSNAFSVLIPSSLVKDPVNGECRIINIMHDRKWEGKIECFPIDILSKLIQNFLDFDALSIGAFEMVNACHLTLEMQPSAFSTVLETITKVTNKYFGIGNTLNLVPPADWEAVHNEINAVIDKYTAPDHITETNAELLKRKTGNLSNPTNIDMLKASFPCLGYELTSDDITIIRNRDKAQHGSIKMSSSYEEAFRDFQNISLGLHRLCSILLLRFAGYHGYIINCQRTFQCDMAAKPLIVI